MRVVVWCAGINITNFSRGSSLFVLVSLHSLILVALSRRARKNRKLVEKAVPSHAVTAAVAGTAVAVDADTVVAGCQRFAALVPLGVVIEVGVYTQTVTVLVFIATKLTRETFKRTVNITDVELEVLLACELTQAPRARIHAYYLAMLHTQRRTEF